LSVCARDVSRGGVRSDCAKVSQTYALVKAQALTKTAVFYNSNAAGDLLGSPLASFCSAVNGNIVLTYGAITAGYYAFKFTSSGTSGYSGQFSARVPAPAALGLVGLGLVGLGVFSRRRAV
jgi:hypothetical protein